MNPVSKSPWSPTLPVLGLITATVVSIGFLLMAMDAGSKPAAVISATALAISMFGIGHSVGCRQEAILRDVNHYLSILEENSWRALRQYDNMKSRVTALYRARQERINRTGPQQVIGNGYRRVSRALP